MNYFFSRIFSLQDMLEVAYEVYRKQGQFFDALRLILRMN
jgi:hypothetical protein